MERACDRTGAEDATLGWAEHQAAPAGRSPNTGPRGEVRYLIPLQTSGYIEQQLVDKPSFSERGRQCL